MKLSPVTVIIPTYNRMERLRHALRSVLTQSALPAEVIVVDDGSCDETGVMVRREFPSVRYVYQENRGVSAARNTGLGLATQEWIGLLDSDDEWLPQKLEKQLLALSKAPSFRFCHTDEQWIRKGRRVNAMKKHSKPDGWIFPQCLPLCCVSPSSVLIHRDVFDAIGGFDEELLACEDYDLWLRIALKYPVLLEGEALLKKHGGHHDQLSRKYWGMDRFRIRALEKVLVNPDLDAENLPLARDMLIRKLEIFLLGAKKRGREDEQTVYLEGRLEYWRERSMDCD